MKSVTHDIVKKSWDSLPPHPRISIRAVFTGYIYYDVTNRTVDRGKATGVTKYCDGYLGGYSEFTNKYYRF